MNREDVIRDNWVDRYLLHQLSEDEQTRFEQFFFACPDTQADIEDTQQLIDGFAGSALAALAGKHQLRVDTPALAPAKPRSNWLALAASLVAAVSLGVAINAQRGPGTDPAADLNVAIISVGATRSVADAQVVTLTSTARRVVFALDVGGELDEMFDVSLKDANGDTLWQASTLVADTYGTVTFALPPNLLADGNFEFVAQRADSTERLRVPLLVEIETD